MTSQIATTRAAPASGAADMLEQLPLFYDFTHQEVRKIAQYAEILDFEPRQPIFELGDPGDRIFFVVSGLVRLSPHRIDAIGPDDFIVRSRAVFGEDCAVDESPRGLGAQSLMRTRCVALGAEALRRLEDESPRMALKLIRKLARNTSMRLRQAVGKRGQPADGGLAPIERPAARPSDSPAGRLALLDRLIGQWRNPDRSRTVQLA